MIINNPNDFIDDYIQDLNKDLQDAIYYDDGNIDKLKIKLETACEIAKGLGANVSYDIIKLELPHINCDWDD